jgi:hypothetical protein
MVFFVFLDGKMREWHICSDMQPSARRGTPESAAISPARGPPDCRAVGTGIAPQTRAFARVPLGWPSLVFFYFKTKSDAMASHFIIPSPEKGPLFDPGLEMFFFPEQMLNKNTFF